MEEACQNSGLLKDEQFFFILVFICLSEDQPLGMSTERWEFKFLGRNVT